MKLDNLNIIIDEIVQNWATEELQYYFERAKKVGKATGQGRKDITVRTIKSITSGISQVLFEFRMYMRYQDIKGLKPGYMPFEEALQWVQARGTGTFKQGFKRRYGKLPSSDVRLMNQIAWGVVKGKRRKHRAKNWYNKPKWKGINVLESRLADKLSDVFLAQTKKELKN